jgi:GNAT superfamily N-acetyltransferase
MAARIQASTYLDGSKRSRTEAADGSGGGKGWLQRRRLMVKLIRQQATRGETPVLHVMRENSNARRLYERIGFRVYRESPVRIVSPC